MKVSRTNGDVPPLRIHHLLVWTALTAAIVSGCMTFDRWFRNGPAITDRIVISGLVLGAAAIAGVITCVGSALIWRRHGIAFPASPGEWLLTIIASCVAGVCGAFALFLAIFFTFGDDDWFGAYFAVIGLAAFVTWLRLNYLGQKGCDTRAWRIVFLILMMSPFAFLGGIVFMAIIIAIIAGVVWASWSDWRKRIARPWTHWCGVAMTISLGISLLCVFAW